MKKTLIILLLLSSVAHAEEPALPMGLGGEEPALPMGIETSEPSLPSGLGDSLSLEGEGRGEGDSPSLPEGLEVAPPPQPSPLKGEGVTAENYSGAEGVTPELPFTGFIETRIGARTQNDPYERKLSIAETRLQLQYEKAWEGITFNLTSDFLYDDIQDDLDEIDLETGTGWMDLREANLLFRPATFLDIKAGRQILTWGTGDLLFINDMFPKDWQSFFNGRDVEYLKAPSDTIKFSFYHDIANLDIVYTPKFNADRFINGSRLSYYNGMSLAGRNAIIDPTRRNEYFDEDEIALRLYKNIKGAELALYGYSGYWKTPEGFDTATGNYIYPRLNVYGASVRKPIFSGIGNMEVGYYDSRDDSNGDDPYIRNSEFRFLVGYERELIPNLTGAVQYYLEQMQDYGEYKAGVPVATKDKNRHLFTVRLTQMLMDQNLTLSLFNFYSPSDEDGYLRANAKYKITDAWQAAVGGNLFYGNHDYSFFGQFENNTNVYASVRMSF